MGPFAVFQTSFTWHFYQAPPQGLQVFLKLVTQRGMIRVGVQNFFPQLWEGESSEEYQVPLRRERRENPLQENVQIVVRLQRALGGAPSACQAQAIFGFVRPELAVDDPDAAGDPSAADIAGVPVAGAGGPQAAWEPALDSAGCEAIPWKNLHLGKYRVRECPSRKLEWLAVRASTCLDRVLISSVLPLPSPVASL